MSADSSLKEVCPDLTLLYVEDDQIGREQYTNIFKLLFREVVTAENGAVALEHYKQRAFDLVITDLTMPHLDGTALIEEIRKINDDQHIIIMTAHNTDENLRQSIDFLVDGILIKPVMMDTLTALLSKTCHAINLEQIPQDNAHDKRDEDVVSMLQDGAYATCMAVIDGFSDIVKKFGDVVKTPISDAVREHLSNFGMEYENSMMLDDDVMIFILPKRYLDMFLSALQNFSQNNHSLRVSIDGVMIYITLSFGVVSTRSEADSRAVLDYLEGMAEKIRNDTKSTFIAAMDIDLEDIKEYNALQWLDKTHKAIKQDTLVPFFQPVVRLENMEVYAYEVFARIKEGDGYILPEFFIDLSEKAGILEDISEIIFKKSYETFSTTPYSFHINITDTEWKDNVLEHYLSYLGVAYGIDPERVILNISNYETFVPEGKRVKRILRFKENGYKIALKGFGEGLININILSLLQPDYIKIDQLLLQRALDDEGLKEIVASLLSYAKKAKIETVLVNVEDELIMETAKSFGIECLQGYIIRPPSPTL